MTGGVCVAIDQGGHATRASAYSAAGQIEGAALVTIATKRNSLGHVEHDPDELVASVDTALAELARLVEPSRWTAAGLAVEEAVAAGTAKSPRLIVTARSDAPFVQPDLLVEGPAGLAFGKPRMEPREGGRVLRFVVPAIPGPETVLAGAPLTPASDVANAIRLAPQTPAWRAVLRVMCIRRPLVHSRRASAQSTAE